MATRRLDLRGLETLSVPITIRGLVVSPSPYDVPQFLTATLDEQTHTLLIAFGYPDEEDVSEQSVDSSLTVLKGKNSGKLLGFLIKGAPHAASEVTVRLVAGVEKQLEQATRDNQRLNYQIIKKVVSNRLGDVLAPA